VPRTISVHLHSFSQAFSVRLRSVLIARLATTATHRWQSLPAPICALIHGPLARSRGPWLIPSAKVGRALSAFRPPPCTNWGNETHYSHALHSSPVQVLGKSAAKSGMLTQPTMLQHAPVMQLHLRGSERWGEWTAVIDWYASVLQSESSQSDCNKVNCSCSLRVASDQPAVWTMVKLHREQTATWETDKHAVRSALNDDRGSGN
jgi:hypothetical protein